MNKYACKNDWVFRVDLGKVLRYEVDYRKLDCMRSFQFQTPFKLD